MERLVTFAAHGHILANAAVWSRDSRRLAYDVRSDPAGAVFDGTRIETVDVETGEVRVVYESRDGACCGAPTYSPTDDRIVFILGPQRPSPQWSYGPARRRGVIVDEQSGLVTNLDARDLTPPFTPGALRGGSHLHLFDARGEWVSFTYHDALFECELRDVAVCVPGREVRVPRTHARNRDGGHFSVVVTRTTPHPTPGSDEICRACEEAWVGTHGYLRPNESRHRRAIAFQGTVVTANGDLVSEVFVVDLPESGEFRAGDGPLEGTATQRPRPPAGVVQRRLTRTAERRHPGLAGPRHWLRSDASGERIAFLMRDDAGVVQIWTVSPRGGQPRQVTRDAWSVASAFSWSPDGGRLAYVADGSVFVVDAESGRALRVTAAAARVEDWPRAEACVFSPDGRRVAYVRSVASGGERWNQVFVVEDFE